VSLVHSASFTTPTHATDPPRSPIASAACTAVRGILSGLTSGERNADESKWLAPGQICTREYRDPIKLASYAIAGGSFSSTPSDAVPSKVFEDPARVYSTFHHLLLIYTALYSLALEPGRVDTLAKKNTQRLYRHLQSEICYKAQTDQYAAARMEAAFRCLPRAQAVVVTGSGVA
jgi:hypothetical protein